MDDIAYVKLHSSTFLVNNNMIKISDIYVRNTGSLLYFNRISMYNYKWDRLPTFMLALIFYIIRSFNLVYVDVIANIQC